MRNSLRMMQYTLYALLIFALSGCGASNTTTAGLDKAKANGKVTAKLVMPKSAAKTVGLAGDNVTKIRLMVTGATIPTAKKDFAPADEKSLEVYPGGNLTVTAYAYDAANKLVYEGFTPNVTVVPATMGEDVDGNPVIVGTQVSVQLAGPIEKVVNTPCLGCHEGTRDTDGQNLVVNYKQSGHYLNDSATFPATSGGKTYDAQAGCAGCHGPSHNDRNPAANGRCFVCHAIGGTAAGINANHGAPNGYVNATNNNCGTCHVTHNYKGKAGCIGCHAIGQNANTPGNNIYVNDNNGVRAIVGEFGKWSHHVTGVNINNAHCIACHLEGKVANDSIAVDTAFHMVDNKTHLRHADTDADIQWDPAAPSFTGMDNFCLSCHDANGATSAGSVTVQTFINDKNIKAAGKLASPSNPFGDTISNQYDMLQRPAVVDAKGQFATANNSHHAVLGKKYTKRTRVVNATDSRAMTAAQSTAFASNSSAALPGKRSTIYDAGKFQSDYITLADAAGESGTRNGGTDLGDDSTLHCADCHTVGQFSNKQSDFNTRYNTAVIGAHGSNNEYLLRNNIGSDQRHQGAETTVIGGNAGTGYGTKPYLVCFNCHAFTTYGTVTANNGEAGNNHAGDYSKDARCNGPFNTIFGATTGEARLESKVTATSAVNYGQLSGAGQFYGNLFGIQCANCHNSGVKGNVFGGIHGSGVDQTYVDGMGNTTKHIRFMPGLGNAMYVPGVKGGFSDNLAATTTATALNNPAGLTKAVYKAYSGNRNGTGAGNSLGQTWSLLPVRTIKNTAAGDNTNGSYEYVTGGYSNDLNWEQRTQQPVAGELDLQSKAVGCYTITPDAPNYTYSVGAADFGPNLISKVTSGSAPAGQQKNPKVLALQAAGYPADDIRTSASTGLTAGDNREVFDIWGGCDDHNGAQGAGTGMVRKVLRKVNY